MSSRSRREQEKQGSRRRNSGHLGQEKEEKPHSFASIALLFSEREGTKWNFS